MTIDVFVLLVIVFWCIPHQNVHQRLIGGYHLATSTLTITLGRHNSLT